jgi:hypothetical protein
VPDVSGSSGEAVGGRNLWRVRAAVRDNPGSLAALAASLAGHGLNILSVQVHAVADGAVDEFLLEAPSGTACTDVVAATETGGGRDVHADRADMHDLVDVPTRVLTLAAQATGSGAQLAVALRALLGAPTVCREDRIGEDQGEPDGVDGTTMRLGNPAGGVLTFERATLAFTPAEFARARALRDLDLRVRDRGSPPHTVQLHIGELSVRPADPSGDLAGPVEVEDLCPAHGVFFNKPPT